MRSDNYEQLICQSFLFLETCQSQAKLSKTHYVGYTQRDDKRYITQPPETPKLGDNPRARRAAACSAKTSNHTEPSERGERNADPPLYNRSDAPHRPGRSSGRLFGLVSPAHAEGIPFRALSPVSRQPFILPAPDGGSTLGGGLTGSGNEPGAL